MRFFVWLQCCPCAVSDRFTPERITVAHLVICTKFQSLHSTTAVSLDCNTFSLFMYNYSPPWRDFIMTRLFCRNGLLRCPGYSAGLERLRLWLLGNKYWRPGCPAALSSLCEGGCYGGFKPLLRPTCGCGRARGHFVFFLFLPQDLRYARLMKWAERTKGSPTAGQSYTELPDWKKNNLIVLKLTTRQLWV